MKTRKQLEVKKEKLKKVKPKKEKLKKEKEEWLKSLHLDENRIIDRTHKH